MIIRLSQSTINVGGRPFLLCENLSLEPGQVYCIRGRSGTGKTSLLKALTGSKSVSVLGSAIEYLVDADDGSNSVTSRLELGVQVSVLQQSAPLWPHLSAFSNAWLPWASQHGFKEMFRRREVAKERARLWLTNLGLNASIWSRRPLSLSGGERQRVALAATLVFDAPCLLLDEPTSSLDRTSINLVSEVLMNEAKKDKLIIVTSHDVDFLENRSWHHLAIEERGTDDPQFCLREVD